LQPLLWPQTPLHLLASTPHPIPPLTVCILANIHLQAISPNVIDYITCTCAFYLNILFHFIWFLYQTGSDYVAQIDQKLDILLPQPRQCWDLLQMHITKPDFTFFFFWRDWSLHACKARALLLKPHLQSILLWLFFGNRVSKTICLGWHWNHNTPNLSLPNSWEYSHIFAFLK
jgi:hypothetical protein